jgi:hypothetical protein
MPAFLQARGAMIAHAWTALCDRCTVDRETDHLSLVTLEVISVTKPDDGEPAVVPCHLEVVSLWYRRDPDQGGQQRARVCILSPDLVPIARLTVEIDLRLTQRFRTRCVIDGLLVQRPGTYLVTVDLLGATPMREVARIPLQVELTRDERGHFQSTSTSQFTSTSTCLPLPSSRCIG